ncbi:hypothetical protein MNJPNG_14955 [Cupriavidus oxalaticus]|uniref:hypothetical protein n=1 Tax=Cupriavidus oxalaticus TaxID=96344 RepID=UPI003F73EC91
MTLGEMTQITLNHWMRFHRGAALKMSKEERLKQAMACARLTRAEMDSLKMIGLDEDTAWTEARTLYCLAPPPAIDR